ncbi:MAG: hypothetical protein H6739_35790 [Alphaproteobacteria bacterium]|nr:hypothetical protein [Alphaproteobacteria bacterium]
MHRLKLNQLHLTLDLFPVGGFLIATGDKGAALLHPERPDRSPMRIRAQHPGTGVLDETVYMPGSTIKGCFRSSAERALRTLQAAMACDPWDRHSACRRRQGRGESDAQVHARQCMVCRTFGSQQTGGHLHFTDALPPDAGSWDAANRTRVRSGVSIDRRTGGPAQGKLYDAELVTGGAFRAHLHLENYQIWQLALLGTLVEDLDAGELRLGSGQTRGLGGFRARIVALEHWQAGGKVRSPAGVGALRPDLAPAYGWLDDGALDVEEPGRPSRGGLRWRWEGEAGAAVLERSQEPGWAALSQRAVRGEA